MIASPDRLDDLSQQIIAGISAGPDQASLRLLLNQVIVYLKRVFYSTIDTESDIAAHPQFNFRKQPASLELARELDYRLNLLASYHLSLPDRISELLTAGLQISLPVTVNHLQTKLIQVRAQNPGIGVVALAKELEISPRTANRELQKLFSQYGIRIAAVLDPHKFGLVHFGVRFQGKSLEVVQAFDTWLRKHGARNWELPFLLGIGLDINQLDGFFSVYVPNQVKSLSKFHQRMEWLQEQFFSILEISRISGFYTNISFDCYDYVTQQWNVPSDLRTEGTLRFIEEHGPQFSPLQGFNYKLSPIRFTQPDWLIALMQCEGVMNKTEPRKLLRHYGYPLADKTIWAHRQRLKNTNAYFPYLAFSRLAFEDIIGLIVKCDETTLEIIHQLLTQFVVSRLFPTSEGAIIFIGVPFSGASLLKQLTHTLLNMPKIKKLTVLRFKRDLPLTPPISTYSLWNSNNQLWYWPNTKKGK